MKTSNQIAEILESSIENNIKSKEFSKFDCPEILVQKPKIDSHGTWSSNIALSLSRILRKDPMIIAEIIKKKINSNELISKINVVEPGFINFEISNSFRESIINKILNKKEKFGSNNIGKMEKIQIEFVSVNPTGPVHVGHARGAVVGSCLAEILSFCGFDVVREYYVNDAGTQIDLYVKSILFNIYSKLKIKFPEPEDGYKGNHVKEIAEEIIITLQLDKSSRILSNNTEIYQKVKELALKNTISKIEKDLKDLGVEYDNWFYESSLFKNKTTNNVLSKLSEKNLVYDKEGAKWFKSSNFYTKDDVVIERSNEGGHTYFFTDMSYHYDKLSIRKFEKVIDIFGADHHSHVDRLKSAISSLDLDSKKLVVLLTQIVHFKNEEKIEKFSKRSGNIYTVKDLIETVGRDSIRFNFLNRSIESQQEFDLDLALKQSTENPVYYVQYAHARLCSILRSNTINFENSDLSLLSTKYEKRLIDHLDFFEDVVENSYKNLETHNITKFSMDLAKELQIFYENCRVLSDDIELSKARLSLVNACKIVLCNLLKILGVNAPERM